MKLLITSILSAALVSCTTTNYAQPGEPNQVARGAATGVVLGAVTGAIIGNNTDGDGKKGALLGGAAGAIGGAVLGHEAQRRGY